VVSRYLDRARQAGLGWPPPAELDDAALERRCSRPSRPRRRRAPRRDFGWVHRELRRKGVTLQLLWMEYKQAHPDGYQYSQFRELYRRWSERVDLVMRRHHRAGDELFIDYATPARQSRSTHPARRAGPRSCSSPCWARATTPSLRRVPPSSWAAGSAHTCAASRPWGRAGAAGVRQPALGVSRAHRYEPLLNRTYSEMAAHYGTAILPARANRPLGQGHGARSEC
jgi:transposase